MTSKQRNTSSRAAKMRRQAKARGARSTRTPSPKLASLSESLKAFEQACAVGYLSAIHPDGHVQQLSFDRIRDHFNAAFAADGESPLAPDELATLLAADLREGEMAMRTDGVWAVHESYFATSEV
ncbi:hypothetical protein OG693_39160 (plasmid) [Streptomyces sp. NBC_01259]|uniref:hypothetical protein n=1 Tax=Streptomyces sp. NBC_01259 TaxID=2903800 RepID=UPI002F90C519